MIGHASHCTCAECAAAPATRPQPIVFMPVKSCLWCGEPLASCDCGDRQRVGFDAAATSPDFRIGTGTELKDLALAFAMRIEELATDGAELKLQLLKPIEGGQHDEIVAECVNVGPLVGRALALALRLLGRP